MADPPSPPADPPVPGARPDGAADGDVPDPLPGGGDGDLVIVPIEADDSAGTFTAPGGPQAPATTADGEDPTVPVGIADGERKRRRAWWKVLVPIVLLAAVAGLGYLAIELFSTPSYAVADLRGMEQDEALAEIADNDWEVTVATERSDEEPRPGRVIRTVPADGVELAEGEPFLVVVSEGPVLRPLPELGGLTLAEAQTAVLELDLAVTTVEQHDEAVPAGQVISWSVPADPSLVAGAEVPPDTEVQIVSSIGPEPRTVPDLTGLALADAQAALDALRLTPVEGEPVFSDTMPAGATVSQTPAPGSVVDRGTAVEVVLSKGPDVVTLPDITTLPYDQAVAVLTEAGFVPVLSLGATDGAFQSASVGGQPAAAGDVFPRGTQVDLVYL